MNDRSPQAVPDSLAVERAERRRQILSSVWYTVPGTIAVIYCSYQWLWPNYAGPETLAHRLAFAAQCVFFAALPVAAGLITSIAKQMAEGAQDPTAGFESKSLRIHYKIVRSTFEHFVWFATSLVAISTRLNPNEMRLLPILTGVFIASRILYWWTYTSVGAARRAPAGQITLTVNIGLMLGTVIVFAVRGVS